MAADRWGYQNRIRRGDGRGQRGGADASVAQSALVGGPVDTCSAAPSQFLGLHTPVAVVVAAMKEYMERVVVVVANVAEDKERAVAATLGEGVQVAAHCVASVVGPAGERDSVVDACEAVTRVDGDVCGRPFDSFVLFLSCHLCSVPSKYIPQQRARVHRG